MLSQQKMIIKVEVLLMMSKRKSCRLCVLLLILISSHLFSDTIDPIEVSLDVLQGGIVVGTVAPGYRLTYSDRELHISSSGTFVFGIGRAASGYAELKVFERNEAMSSKKIEIMIRHYEENYAVKDKQDVLAMCALQLATQNEQENIHEEKSSSKIVERIEKINQSINEALDL